jgi:hypothetical protein
LRTLRGAAASAASPASWTVTSVKAAARVSAAARTAAGAFCAPFQSSCARIRAAPAPCRSFTISSTSSRVRVRMMTVICGSVCQWGWVVPPREVCAQQIASTQLRSNPTSRQPG